MREGEKERAPARRREPLPEGESPCHQGLVFDALVLRPDFYRGPTSVFKSQWLRDALKDLARVRGAPVAAEVRTHQRGGGERERERMGARERDESPSRYHSYWP